MPHDKQQAFALQMVMVAYSDLPDIVERSCDNCSFEKGCPFSEFLIVDCPMTDKKSAKEQTCSSDTKTMTLAEWAHYQGQLPPNCYIRKYVKNDDLQFLYLFMDGSILIANKDHLRYEVHLKHVLPGDDCYEYYLRRIKP